MTTLLLTGAHLADGTGRSLRAADVLLDANRIHAVEPPGTLPLHHPTRDLTGLVLAPGFIDVHSHADNAPLLPYDDTTKILQGVTTEVVGNCGFSLAPHSTAHSTTLSTFTERIFPPIDFTWSTFHELYATTDDHGYVTHHCPLVGHGTLRIAALGMANQRADDDALHDMRRHLDEGMTAGAFGLSSGLIYPPAVFSDTAELSALVEILGGDGLYATHMRNESDALVDAITEALTIGRAAGRTHLSHLKAAGRTNWGSMPRALDTIRAARDAGDQVLHDVYPYTASSTMLTATLPPDFLADDEDTILARLTSSTGRDRVAAAHRDTDWNDILISTTASHTREGCTLAELAEHERTEPVDALIDLLVTERLRVSMVHFSMHDDDLETALADEHTMIGSDGLPPGTGGKPHPRLYGTFPRILGRYCRDRGLLDLPEAIRRMTSLPARAFRIPERGVVAPGYIADLVAFDQNTVRDVGDYRDPIHPPRGIDWVCQDGRTVVADGTHLGGRHGRRLTPSG
jgi:dihydroorotase/N-acyl-D-amino-acid deacylase